MTYMLRLWLRLALYFDLCIIFLSKYYMESQIGQR